MSQNLIAKATTTINTPAARVWDALTNPELIKQYLFGTNAISDWQEGSSIEFTGNWEGQEYRDKGTILQIKPEKLFQYSYFSPLTGLEDSPENYANISYELDEDEGKTNVVVRQENIQDLKLQEQSEKNWQMVLQTLKELLERNN